MQKGYQCENCGVIHFVYECECGKTPAAPNGWPEVRGRGLFCSVRCRDEWAEKCRKQKKPSEYTFAQNCLGWTVVAILLFTIFAANFSLYMILKNDIKDKKTPSATAVENPGEGGAK